ncbi:hypothetical protein F5Y12DRAFT_675048 [Xylaria sp. FL1777]|nr:hypothetical protein F5Y12DRAFT_675048 [Xylaria sp. FL1777]
MMAQQHGHILSLPQELHIDIVRRLDSLNDVSSIVKLNRYFHGLFFDYLFDLKFTEIVQPARKRAGENFPQTLDNTRRSPEFRYYYRSLFLHALATDSSWIIEHMATHKKELSLMEPLRRGFSERAGYKTEIGYLHFALAGDAPRVAAYMLKSGVDMGQEVNGFPELMPLCLALSMSRISTQEKLDASLRIACSYVLPRTVTYLLVRGANPNTYSPYGLNAIHSLLVARLPRLAKDYVYTLNFGVNSVDWESRIPTVLATLLAYGSDVHSPTQTTFKHECHPGCWKSINCSHEGQTALHLVAASKIPKIISRLVESGADPQLLDGDGYTPLYEALRQENEAAVDMFLGLSVDKNPIVHGPRRSTALHIACRFAYKDIVDQLLRAGVSANVVDSHGYTPLHEVLKHMDVGRDKDVLDTLQSLRCYEADPDIPTSIPTPRELAKSHPIQAVREMFESYIVLLLRPARIHTRKNLEVQDRPAKVQDRPAKVQADPTPKIRAWKNPKSLVGTSVRPIPTKGAREQARENSHTPRPLEPVPVNNTPSQKVELSPLPGLRSAWIGGDISKILGPPPPSRGDQQQFRTKEVPKQESFPALTEDHGTSFVSGDSISAAASFWGGLSQWPAASQVNGEQQPEQKGKPKRGRARWKPFVP